MKGVSLGQIGQRLQGHYILPVARIAYLGAAALCWIAVLGGLTFALIYQFQTYRSVVEEPVPAAISPDLPIDISTITARFAAPTNLQVRAAQGLIFEPLTSDSVVAIFAATSPHGLAEFPDDILILGGAGAPMFERTGMNVNGVARTVLTPAPELIQAINQELPMLSTQVIRLYELRVAARDIYGNLSEPVNMNLSLILGPTPPTPEAAAAASVAPSVPSAQGDAAVPLTAYQTVARDVALIVDPNRTPTYFEAYQRALAVPGECGANDHDDEFATDARTAFDQVRARILPANVEAFYAGLCSAWREAQRAEIDAANASESARLAVLGRNSAARAAAEARSIGAGLLRNVALGVVGMAIVVFLIIALLLAVLAIENHSKTMRESIEAMARARTDGGVV